MFSTSQMVPKIEPTLHSNAGGLRRLDSSDVGVVVPALRLDANGPLLRAARALQQLALAVEAWLMQGLLEERYAEQGLVAATRGVELPLAVCAQ